MVHNKSNQYLIYLIKYFHYHSLTISISFNLKVNSMLKDI